MKKEMNLDALKASPVLYQLLSSLTKIKLPEITKLMSEINEDPEADHSQKALNILKFDRLRSYGEKSDNNSLIGYEVTALENEEVKSYINIGRQEIVENFYHLKDEDHYYLEDDNEHLERVGNVLYSTSIYKNIYDAHDDYFGKVTLYEGLLNEERKIKMVLDINEIDLKESNKNSHNDNDELIENKLTIEEIITNFKKENPDSELILNNIESPYHSQRNSDLLDEIAGISPDSLAECYDDVKSSTCAFLWNECVHINEINRRGFSVSDFWDHFPTKRQEEIIEALYDKLILKNSHNTLLLEYKWKDEIGEEKSKPVYQVKEERNHNNRSISTYNIVDAENIFDDLKNVKKNKMTPF